MSTRYCVDCRHYSKAYGIFPDACHRPQGVSPVTGEPTRSNAATERRFSHLCGNEGKYFESGRVVDPKRFSFSSWLKGER